MINQDSHAQMITTVQFSRHATTPRDLTKCGCPIRPNFTAAFQG
jgi:hypothetical protein